MINCTVLKLLGDFNIAKNQPIIITSFCSGTDAGLGEIESMTRIKEHPSYVSRTCSTAHFYNRIKTRIGNNQPLALSIICL